MSLSAISCVLDRIESLRQEPRGLRASYSRDGGDGDCLSQWRHRVEAIQIPELASQRLELNRDMIF